MDKSEKKLRNRIAELRKDKGLTIQQVADGIGVSNGTISRYEKGSREPKLETWMKLADFFDVPVSYLQGISENKATIHTSVNKSVSDVISIIYSLLIYMEKHPNMSKVPVTTLNGIVLSKKAFNALLNASMYFGWLSENKIYSSIKQVASNISKENYSNLNKISNPNDIENICFAFRDKAIQLFNDTFISNKSLIDGAIEGVDTALSVLNMRAFGDSDSLPSNVDTSLYHTLVQVFENAKKQIISLSKTENKSSKK